LLYQITRSDLFVVIVIVIIIIAAVVTFISRC